MKPFLFALAILVCLSATAAAEDTCPNGTAYKVSANGETIVVKRFGIGETEFAQGAGPQPGMALDFVTQTGIRGAVFGPMRSIMFVTDPETLTKAGYQWEPASPDPDGVYRVMSDDGQSEMFTLSYAGCAD